MQRTGIRVSRGASRSRDPPCGFGKVAAKGASSAEPPRVSHPRSFDKSDSNPFSWMQDAPGGRRLGAGYAGARERDSQTLRLRFGDYGALGQALEVGYLRRFFRRLGWRGCLGLADGLFEHVGLGG